MRRARGAALTLAAVSTVWCLLIAAPPVLRTAGHPAPAALVRASFAPVCHQIPSRSFLIDGAPLAVCARCTGIYAGFLAGCFGALALWRRSSPRERLRAPGRALLLLAAIPSAAGILAEWSGLLSDAPMTRALSGSPLGFVIVFYVLPAIVELPAEIAGELRRLAPTGGRSNARAR